MSFSGSLRFAAGTALALCITFPLGRGLQAQTPVTAVPDEIALMHLFRMVQDDDKEAAQPHARRTNAYLATVGLNSTDRGKLIAQANQFKAQEAVLAKRAADVHAQAKGALSAEHRKQLEDLNRQKYALLTQAVTGVMGDLSPAGAQKVRAFVDQRMKPNIRMFHP